MIVINEEPDRTVLEFTIAEGKNRQIRKMCEAVDLTVKRLRRTNIGGVKLGMLKPGQYADLTKQEMQALRNAMGVSSRTEYGGTKASPKNNANRGGKRKW